MSRIAVSLQGVAPSREAVIELQRAMAEMPQTELETRHHFAGGTYCRELLIPKGVTLVGKVHRHEHLCMLVKGDMTIVDDTGRRRIKAPQVFVSAPGAKRAGFAHRDSIFITVHRTDSRDLEQIEREAVEEDPLAMFDAANRLRKIQESLS